MNEFYKILINTQLHFAEIAIVTTPLHHTHAFRCDYIMITQYTRY